MLDVIQLTGTERKLYLVYETCPPLFTDLLGNYEDVRMIVVASVNYRNNGKLFDWAAYLGLVPQDWGMAASLEAVSRHGNKLSEDEVKFYLHGQPYLTKLLKNYRN